MWFLEKEDMGQTGEEGKIEASLRWYDPDQVQRVCLSHPQATPLASADYPRIYR
jgi:hypothetical protein